MSPSASQKAALTLQVRPAVTDDDLRAAQRLRYDVFIREYGGSGPGVDHSLRLECDRIDEFAQHLLLVDPARDAPDQVVGTYRYMTQQMAEAAGGFYCAAEYDLAPLLANGGRLLELGRSCLHPDYRGGAGMVHLWAGLADVVAAHKIDTLFGVASFHGTDIGGFAQSLSLLHHTHLAPPELRVSANGRTAQSMEMLALADIDRLAAVRQMPALIKAYLRLGATVGDGAFVDYAFKTTDVCIILQADAISDLQKSRITQGVQRV